MGKALEAPPGPLVRASLPRSLLPHTHPASGSPRSPASRGLWSSCQADRVSILPGGWDIPAQQAPGQSPLCRGGASRVLPGAPPPPVGGRGQPGSPGSSCWHLGPKEARSAWSGQCRDGPKRRKSGVGPPAILHVTHTPSTPPTPTWPACLSPINSRNLRAARLYSLSKTPALTDSQSSLLLVTTLSWHHSIPIVRGGS